jgi:hypothetical protein
VTKETWGAELTRECCIEVIDAPLEYSPKECSERLRTRWRCHAPAGFCLLPSRRLRRARCAGWVIRLCQELRAFQNTAIGFGAIATGDCTTSAAFGNQIRAHPLPLQQIASTE